MCELVECLPTPVCSTYLLKVCFEDIIYPHMHTPGYISCIPVAFTSDIVLDTQFEFLRFKQPKNKASMTLLHYVVSHPSAHPFRMARRRHDTAKVHFFSRKQEKIMFFFSRIVFFIKKRIKTFLNLRFPIENLLY